ncbi:MAG: hypothetical protein AAGF90_13205, partial [Pseudomonadota bacterium]
MTAILLEMPDQTRIEVDEAALASWRDEILRVLETAGDAGAAASETIFALVCEAFEVAEATAISGWGSGPAWADAVFSAVARLAAGNEWVAGAVEADLPAGDAAPSQDGALEASL